MSLVTACIIMAGYFLLYTAAGNRQAVRYMSSQYGDIQSLDIAEGGNIGEGITMLGIVLKDLKGLPEGSALKIGRLFVQLTSLGVDGLAAGVENARLQIPGSEPILIMGTFRQQRVALNIFSRGFTVGEVLTYIPNLKGLIPLKGEVSNVDLYVKGDYLEPEVTGTFEIREFIYKGFILTDSFWNVEMELKDMKKDIKLFGTVMIERGILQTDKVSVKLKPGRISFAGPLDKPEVDFKGESRVEQTQIKISVKGTLEKPELMLSSIPPYSEQKLMVMLATGKSWQSVENAIDSGVSSADLTADFIDYFFFAGKANRFAEQFGVRDFSLTLDGNAKGVSAKKDLTEKLEVGYGVKQQDKESGESVVSQKLQGAYKLTDTLSVGIERESKKESGSAALDNLNAEPVTKDKVYLEYKKEF